MWYDCKEDIRVAKLDYTNRYYRTVRLSVAVPEFCENVNLTNFRKFYKPLRESRNFEDTIPELDKLKTYMKSANEAYDETQKRLANEIADAGTDMAELDEEIKAIEEKLNRVNARLEEAEEIKNRYEKVRRDYEQPCVNAKNTCKNLKAIKKDINKSYRELKGRYRIAKSRKSGLTSSFTHNMALKKKYDKMLEIMEL